VANAQWAKQSPQYKQAIVPWAGKKTFPCSHFLKSLPSFPSSLSLANAICNNWRVPVCNEL